MADKIAIQVKNVHKEFYLPHHKSDSIKQSIVHMFDKKDKGADYYKALKGISFDVKEGEFLGIVGRNGSGKSTLLKILSNIYVPTSGSVKHSGKLVPFIELGVGFKAELTGRENVYLNGALLGFSKKEIDERYDAIVEFAELGEFMEQKIKNYSSGMKVRLAFAVATHADADILLLDEVLAVGDAAFQRKCYEYFWSLKEQRKTIIFVTHSMNAVREYCDRAILINDGKVTHEGDPEKVADEYLMLFNKSADSEATKDQSDRWGSRHLTFKTIKAVVDKDNVTLNFVVKNNKGAIKDVVIGVDVRGRDKKLVGSTETFRINNGKLSFAANEEKKIALKLKNIFGGGDFTVAASLKTEDQATIYDFWRTATTFTNTEEESQYSPIILPSSISTEK